MNLDDIRTQLQATVELAEREVEERRDELGAALDRLHNARKERNYWDEVRTADEILRLCLQPLDGRALPNVPARGVERDGVMVYICMAYQPCPIHAAQGGIPESDRVDEAPRDHVADAVAEGRDALAAADRFVDRLVTVARDMGASDTVIAGITQRWDSFANRVEARLTEEGS